VEREAPQQNESTLFEAALESKKEKLRRKTPNRKTLNAQHRIQTHAVKFWRRPALRLFFNLSIQRREGTPSPASIRDE
jgi:hypothetical protein